MTHFLSVIIMVDVTVLAACNIIWLFRGGRPLP